MKCVKQMIISTNRRPTGRHACTVPLVLPHGGADAGRDFESAFEVLQKEGETREVWRRGRLRIPLARAS